MASTRVSGFETGEYDVAGEIPTENYHDFDGNDDVKLYTHNAGVLTAFLNMNEGVFADEEIRKCALMAIDCEAAALAAYGEKELFNIDPNLGNPENAQWATDAGKKYFNQADAKPAKKALAKTSYAGETVKLLTTPDYKDMYNATVALQEQLEKAGFTAEVDSYEFATFMDIRSGKPEQWDLFVASTNYKPIPAQSLSVSRGLRSACPTRRRSSSWLRPAPPRTPTPRPRSGPRLRSVSMRSPSSSRFATTLPSRAPRQTSRTSRCSTAPSSGTPSVRSNAIDGVAA